MALGDKYHAAETSFEPGDADYDAADYNYQIVDHSDDVIALCPTKEIRDRLLKLLNDSEGPTQGHADQHLRDN